MRALLACIVLMAASFSAFAPPNFVPEPATLPLMVIGVAAALLIARRGKK